VIIDSGASVNVISNAVWEKLKENKIKCKSEKSDKKLYAYGSKTPLSVMGKFSCNVCLKSRDQRQNIPRRWGIYFFNNILRF
jgi:predicted transcriptional regulator YdeE